MNKPIRIVTTKGVEALNIDNESMKIIANDSVCEYKHSNGKEYFLQWIVGIEGFADLFADNRFIKTTAAVISKKFWVMFDEYEDFIAMTILLPEER